VIRFLSMIALLALLGCAGNKPVPEQKANIDNDHKCAEFFELVNKKMSASEFEILKEYAKELGLELNEPVDVYERTCFQMLESHYSFRCNETISCNQKDFCISIFFPKDNKIADLLPILKEFQAEE